MDILAETKFGGQETRFLLFELPKLGDLFQMPKTKSLNFALLTALDLTSHDIEMAAPIAERLLRNGLAYLCAWGSNCEAWHDLVDHTDGALGMQKADPNDVVMTTWHSKEPLEEALWFFTYCAWPTAGFASICSDYIIACAPQYSDRVKQYFSREFI